MGLLDPNLFTNPALLNQLKGLLGNMPIAKLIRGEESVTQEGLLGSMRAMPVFQNDAGQSAYDAAMNIGPMGLGKIVYHGSPHKFDKFDASKIGTGEGAQAYGHGVYLADSPGVAQGYAEKLSDPDAFVTATSPKWAALAETTNKLKPPRAVPQDFEAQLKNYADDGFYIAKKALAGLRSGRLKMDDGGGALYKADLPDEWIPKMLDWDKPLSQQSPEVKTALKQVIPQGEKTWMHGAVSPKPVTDAAIIEQLNKLEKSNPSAIENSGYYIGDPFAMMTGKDVHYMLGGMAVGSSGGGEQILRQAGIPGIRYLDGGSRPNSGRITMLEQTIANLQGKGASKAAISNAQRELDAEIARASYNYVVFPGLEDQVKILERNGAPLNGLLGGM